MISRVKGTRDILDLRLFNFIINSAKKHFTTYHFSEIETPILEPIELFKRSLGAHTDVVSKEMYCFSASEGGDEVCLRPEVTASTVRAFVENRIDTIPWKVFSWGPMFRHERPQKGRYRQFYQINAEVIGSASITQDAFFLKMLDRFFSDVLRLNSYALKINFLGCPEDRTKYKQVLDKFLDKHLTDLCGTCTERKSKNILRIFDCKNSRCQEIYANAPHLTDHLCGECAAEWQQLQDQLSMISTSFVHDPTLVRGLDYYNKTVFEFVSGSLGAQNAFCGGGRYDQLVQYCGAREDQPSLGAAMGIDRLMLLLEPLIDTLPLDQLPALAVVIPLDSEQHALSLFIADLLSSNGIATDLLVDGSVKSRMRKANKMAARCAIILGSQEQESHLATVKNMMTGEEVQIKQVELVEYVKKMK